MMLRPVLLLLLAALLSSEAPYAADGRCDGYPRVSLLTSKGSCVGLVAAGLGFPRGVAAVGEDLFITDLGSWEPGHGRLLRLSPGERVASVVIDRLDRPGAIVADARGRLIVALAGKVVRIDPKAADPAAAMVTLMTGIPSDGRHNLPGLLLDRKGGLLVSIGSASDNCEGRGGARPPPDRPCAELSGRPPRASHLYIAKGQPLPVDAPSAAVFATGMRNTLALAEAPYGTILAASNGRDAIDQADPKLADARFPHDVLLRVHRGSRFDWPYCFDLGRPSPEFPKADCKRFDAPAMLLPPHAAPLSMLVYRGERLRGLKGKLLIAFHGYRAAGHRLVSLPIDRSGRPIGALRDIVSGWKAVTGLRPQGAPVALLELADGSVLIVEDHNGTLLRLSSDRPARTAR
ncbi:PQQ-dependent sugar dehydrogenase [Sphingomonas jaspsi]|uniref:PQQ-dependent sugar dehydrogenase n=1 Tax=Sphingomonas jaspsi TaxID=392409 RepID=UPI0004AFDE28|nr:hypothetical protein [Sphingomonas jaspsi]